MLCLLRTLLYLCPDLNLTLQQLHNLRNLLNSNLTQCLSYQIAIKYSTSSSDYIHLYPFLNPFFEFRSPIKYYLLLDRTEFSKETLYLPQKWDSSDVASILERRDFKLLKLETITKLTFLQISSYLTINVPSNRTLCPFGWFVWPFFSYESYQIIGNVALFCRKLSILSKQR